MTERIVDDTWENTPKRLIRLPLYARPLWDTEDNWVGIPCHIGMGIPKEEQRIAHQQKDHRRGRGR